MGTKVVWPTLEHYGPEFVDNLGSKAVCRQLDASRVPLMIQCTTKQAISKLESLGGRAYTCYV